MILYINLDDAIDRRNSMEAQFDQIGLEYVRIPGVDARRNEDLLKMQLPKDPLNKSVAYRSIEFALHV